MNSNKNLYIYLYIYIFLLLLIPHSTCSAVDSLVTIQSFSIKFRQSRPFYYYFGYDSRVTHLLSANSRVSSETVWVFQCWPLWLYLLFRATVVGFKVKLLSKSFHSFNTFIIYFVVVFSVYCFPIEFISGCNRLSLWNL